MMYQKPEVNILGNASSVIQSAKIDGPDNLADDQLHGSEL
jgi:hypothetical protein